MTAGKAVEGSGPGDSRAQTVLVIDDYDGARELVGYILRREGYEVVGAANGVEGLRLARELRPAAIVLDVVMPEMDGWTVLQELRADPGTADIPVVMATVLAEQSKGYVFGATEYLTKPLDRRQLVGLLGRLVRDRSAGPVLVVEDDAGTREITAWALEHEGWQVAEAENGRQALEQVAARRPQLILLDLVMPEMDGFDFIDRLYQTPAWRSIPIVVLTAHELSAEEGHFLNQHVNQVLNKGSHSSEELLETIRDLVKGSLPDSPPESAG